MNRCDRCFEVVLFFQLVGELRLLHMPLTACFQEASQDLQVVGNAPRS